MNTNNRKSNKVIVTGGAGFIGSHLVERLVALEYEVHVIDNLVAGKREQVHSKATLHVIDIRDKEKLVPIFNGADTVFHLAALPSVPYSIENPIETHEVNALGTLNVIMASRDAGVRRIVYSSSSAVYGDQEKMPVSEEVLCEPISPYGLQKFESEHYLRLASELYGLETVSLRYFNLYGPRQNAVGPYASVIARFIDQCAGGEPLTVVGEGKQTRDFVHVLDVVEANIRAMDSAHVGKGEAVNIGGGKSYNVLEVADLVGGAINYLPPRIEIMDSLADITRAHKLLEWEPRQSFTEGINSLKQAKGPTLRTRI